VELYNRVRPRTFKGIIGNEAPIKAIQTFLKNGTLPHTMAMLGPSGTGKTTVSKILATKLGCTEGDFTEINGADNNGIQTVRDIRRMVSLCPAGNARVWYFDEAHRLTTDAQNALLKMTEEPPVKTAYFIFATTDAHKIIPTLLGRCTKFSFKPLTPAQMRNLIIMTADDEKLTVSDRNIDLIINVADGSARVALKLLELAAQAEDDKAAAELIQSSDQKAQAYAIFDGLMKGIKWTEMAKLIPKVVDDHEGIRRMILACCDKRMLGAGRDAERAFSIFQVFRDHWYDCKPAGLVGSCYDVLTASK
jgi:DNA polymerase III gamma/tau subunit